MCLISTAHMHMGIHWSMQHTGDHTLKKTVISPLETLNFKQPTPIHVEMRTGLLLCVQTVTAAGSSWTHRHFMSRICCSTSVFLECGPRKSFCPLFYDPWILRGKRCDTEVPFIVEHSTDSCSLHLDRLRVFSLLPAPFFLENSSIAGRGEAAERGGLSCSVHTSWWPAKRRVAFVFFIAASI